MPNLYDIREHIEETNRYLRRIKSELTGLRDQLVGPAPQPNVPQTPSEPIAPPAILDSYKPIMMTQCQLVDEIMSQVNNLAAELGLENAATKTPTEAGR